MPARSRRRNRRRALAAVVCLSYWGVPGHAATSTWNTFGGNWSVAGNWTPSGAPLSGTVLITNTDAINRVITFDETSAVSLTALTIDNTAGGTDSLSMTGAGLSLASTNEFIGDSSSSTLIGSGALIQSVGTNAVSGTLNMAFGADDTGTYSLSGPPARRSQRETKTSVTAAPPPSPNLAVPTPIMAGLGSASSPGQPVTTASTPERSLPIAEKPSAKAAPETSFRPAGPTPSPAAISIWDSAAGRTELTYSAAERSA